MVLSVISGRVQMCRWGVTCGLTGGWYWWTAPLIWAARGLLLKLLLNTSSTTSLGRCLTADNATCSCYGSLVNQLIPELLTSGHPPPPTPSRPGLEGGSWSTSVKQKDGENNPQVWSDRKCLDVSSQMRRMASVPFKDWALDGWLMCFQ